MIGGSTGVRVKVAVTERAWLIVTTQLPVPEQPSPLQPAKVEPAAAAPSASPGVSCETSAWQVAPQLIPAGELVTEPAPVPALITEELVGRIALKVAVTERAWLIVTTQLPVPEQPSPLQPAKVEPAAADAVSVTSVFSWKQAWQVAPQLIPAGELRDRARAGAGLDHGRAGGSGSRVKVAVTERAWLIVTTQLPVPEQPSPLQPAKVEPAAAVAVRVTAVFSAKPCEQVTPQSIPAGLLVTVPDPVPALLTARAWVAWPVGEKVIRFDRVTAWPAGTFTSHDSPAPLSINSSQRQLSSNDSCAPILPHTAS